MEIVKEIKKNIAQAVKSYQHYYLCADNESLKNFVHCLLDQEKEHAKTISEMEQYLDMETGFHEIPANLHTLLQEMSFDHILYDKKGNEATKPAENDPEECIPWVDIYAVIMEYEKRSAEVYKLLSQQAVDAEVADLFGQLAKEEQKHCALAKSRHDLEQLK